MDGMQRALHAKGVADRWTGFTLPDVDGQGNLVWYGGGDDDMPSREGPDAASTAALAVDASLLLAGQSQPFWSGGRGGVGRESRESSGGYGAASDGGSHLDSWGRGRNSTSVSAAASPVHMGRGGVTPRESDFGAGGSGGGGSGGGARATTTSATGIVVDDAGSVTAASPSPTSTARGSGAPSSPHAVLSSAMRLAASARLGDLMAFAMDAEAAQAAAGAAAAATAAGMTTPMGKGSR